MILDLKNIGKTFTAKRGIFSKSSGHIMALEGVNLSVNELDTIGIVGESGCGKTTLAKIILKLIPPSSGEIDFNPSLITDLRKDVQIIFQNPYASLDPKMKIQEVLSEPLLIHKVVSRKAIKERAIQLLKMVGLDETILKRLPIEFSGGQRQRICIARSLASQPKLIVLDEPLSSLDLTVQAQMLDLFAKLKAEFRLTYLFISHNLAVIKHIADRVIVMREGRIVEEGSCDKIFSSPESPYTRSLLEAATS